jgi:cell wall-associated NlpC family hydrolase
MNSKKLIWNAGILFVGVVAVLFWLQTIAVLTQKSNVAVVNPEVPAAVKTDTLTEKVEQPTEVKKAEVKKLTIASRVKLAKNKLKRAKTEAGKRILKVSTDANHVVTTGLNRIGRPYVFGGTSDRGFDCSGFVKFVFGEAGVEVPRSSELLAKAGIKVPITNARRGDILIFTGTNSRLRSPGHVGIVISEPGEKLSFVHASSNGGVKVSQVPGTNYERRFLEVRRVL